MFNVESQLTEEDVSSVNITSNKKHEGASSKHVTLLSFLKENWCVWNDGISLSANIIDKKYKEAEKVNSDIKRKSKDM